MEIKHGKVCTYPKSYYVIGTHMSTIVQRDKQPKGSGKAPAFQIRINPELKEQMANAAAKEGMSLGNWVKQLVRAELLRQGINPKG